MRGRAEHLLLDDFGIALHRIDRRAQLMKQLAQAIGAALGTVVDRCERTAEAPDIAIEAPIAAGETRGGIDDPFAFDRVGPAQADRHVADRLAIDESGGEILAHLAACAPLR